LSLSTHLCRGAFLFFLQKGQHFRRLFIDMPFSFSLSAGKAETFSLLFVDEGPLNDDISFLPIFFFFPFLHPRSKASKPPPLENRGEEAPLPFPPLFPPIRGHDESNAHSTQPTPTFFFPPPPFRPLRSSRPPQHAPVSPLPPRGR